MSGTEAPNIEVNSTTRLLSALADERAPLILALLICGLWTLVSIAVPPRLNFDPAMGMLEWRTLLAGGPAHTIIAPDPANIARDRAAFVAWWSPGQYLVPGWLTLTGLRLGAALSLTAGLSLLCCLLGWIRVFRYFAVSAGTTTLAVLFLSTFIYSTLPFRFFNGGEILLQAALPWLVLAGCRVPTDRGVQAFVIAAAALLIAFFAKLTGIIVACAALAAGSFTYILRSRRLSIGMFAGAAGAVTALWVLYLHWFSHGATPASGAGWVFQSDKVLFAALAPWGAGVSWMDLWEHVWLKHRSTLILFLLPPLLLFAPIIVRAYLSERDPNAKFVELIRFSACFCAIYCVWMELLYLHGGTIHMRAGTISIDERHLRSAGTLIFMCALVAASRLPNRSLPRLVVLGFCALMSLAGIFSVLSRAVGQRPEDVDPNSGIRLVKLDRDAIAFARSAFAQEGRRAVFVLPSADAANALPLGARIISTHIDVETDDFLAARKFAGRIRGHLYVFLRSDLAWSSKGSLLLGEFTDYPSGDWDIRHFGDTIVFVHAPPK